MPKDQLYHEWYRKKWAQDKFDRRAQIMSAYREAIISQANRIGLAQYKFMNDKFKTGVPVFDKMKEIGDLFPSNDLLENYNKTMTNPTFIFRSQAKFQERLITLHKKLRGPKNRP